MTRNEDVFQGKKNRTKCRKKPFTRDENGWISEHVCIDGIIYTLVDGMKIDSEDGEPQHIHQARVNGVKDLEVKAVTIPETVTYCGMTFPVTCIGIIAFQDCLQLKRIDFPKSLQYIDMEAFFGCPRLEKVVLPDGLKRIGYVAFGDCCRLKLVSVKNLSDISMEGNVFRGSNLNLKIINRDEVYETK